MQEEPHQFPFLALIAQINLFFPIAKVKCFPGWKRTTGCNKTYADSKTIPSERTDEFSYQKT